jgi:hypothetical protein
MHFIRPVLEDNRAKPILDTTAEHKHTISI